MTEDSTSVEPNTTQPPNQDNTALQASSAELIYDRLGQPTDQPQFNQLNQFWD